jgi:hypothetical protein
MGPGTRPRAHTITAPDSPKIVSLVYLVCTKFALSESSTISGSCTGKGLCGKHPFSRDFGPLSIPFAALRLFLPPQVAKLACKSGSHVEVTCLAS